MDQSSPVPNTHSSITSDSILEKLKKSIDNIHCIQIADSKSCKKLEIQISSSYILKDKALEFNILLSPRPDQFSEDHFIPYYNDHPTDPQVTSPIKNDFSISLSPPYDNYSPKSPGSQFNTKAEFIRPMQKITDGSPCSVGSEEFIKLQTTSGYYQSPSLNEQVFFLDSIKSPCFVLRKIEYDIESCNDKEMIEKAREEIKELTARKQALEMKVERLKGELKAIFKVKEEEKQTIRAIEEKLEKLEAQQVEPEEDPRLPEARLNVAKLEKEIVQLKSLKDSSVFQYKEELKDVNHKLKDLKECNKILQEILACFRKMPLVPSSPPSSQPSSTSSGHFFHTKP